MGFSSDAENCWLSDREGSVARGRLLNESRLGQERAVVLVKIGAVIELVSVENWRLVRL